MINDGRLCDDALLLGCRRELADNFCYYQKKYDSIECCYEWARLTLELHAKDKVQCSVLVVLYRGPSPRLPAVRGYI
jgi:hypothetical protein